MSIFPKKDIKLKNNNRLNIHELIEIVVIVGTFCIFCSSLCNTIFSIDIQYPWNYENANIIFHLVLRFTHTHTYLYTQGKKKCQWVKTPQKYYVILEKWLELNSPLEFVLPYLDLPSSVLMDDGVQPLTDAKK